MARPFSIPAIPALAVGESYVVAGNGKRGEVARKVSAYAGRAKPPKEFSVVSEGDYGVRVTRLPDPEPEVA